jgi:hypothetical protein
MSFKFWLISSLKPKPGILLKFLLIFSCDAFQSAQEELSLISIRGADMGKGYDNTVHFISAFSVPLLMLE